MAYRVPSGLRSFVRTGAVGGSGTIVCDEEGDRGERIVSGVAYSRDEAKISLLGLSSTAERRRRSSALAEATSTST
jgi:aspartate kinase